VIIHGQLALHCIVEETEHSLSTFRTACRLLPGQQAPMFFLAKELSRTSNHSLALQVLHGALEICSEDVMILNELGVIYMHQGRLGEALQYLLRAGHLVTSADALRSSGDLAVLNNVGTCLRKSGKLGDALEWYQLSLGSRPGDAATHAHIGFTHHLLRELDEAVESYHLALALQPGLAFCSEMLTRALDDMYVGGEYLDGGDEHDDDEEEEENSRGFMSVNSFPDAHMLMEDSSAFTPISSSASQFYEASLSR
jgi:anaphase-promoting complex subunit 6